MLQNARKLITSSLKTLILLLYCFMFQTVLTDLRTLLSQSLVNHHSGYQVLYLPWPELLSCCHIE